MKRIRDIIILSLSFILIFLWLNFSVSDSNSASNFNLNYYDLQVFLLNLMGVFLVRKIFKKKNNKSSLNFVLQISFLNAAVLLLIYSTGVLASPFFSLLYLILFLTIFFSYRTVAVAFMVGLASFFYFFVGSSSTYLSQMMSLVIILLILFFAKKQYQNLLKEKIILDQEREKIIYYKTYAEKKKEELLNLENMFVDKDKNLDFKSFLQNYLLPKLNNLQKMSKNPQNQIIMQSQLTLLLFALSKFNKPKSSHEEEIKEEN